MVSSKKKMKRVRREQGSAKDRGRQSKRAFQVRIDIKLGRFNLNRMLTRVAVECAHLLIAYPLLAEAVALGS